MKSIYYNPNRAFRIDAPKMLLLLLKYGTFTVDVTFISHELNEFNVVIDMGEALRITKEVLSKLNYKNLDELPQFKNQLTTTELLATYIQKEIKKEAASVFNGTLNITLGESHNAWAVVIEL
ncbi:6-carboxytetrahydropterin synthase [Flavobacteriaceae bacterium]|nr:6-carboxytetrahydropterin synthase [Flavobacteriaceae bacterium]